MSMKLNDQLRHIFKEAILDAELAIKHGQFEVQEHMNKFEKFLELDEVPLQDMDYLHAYYKKNHEHMASIGLADPQLQALKAEIDYVWNYINSLYTFEEVSGMLIVKTKEASHD